MKVMQACSPLFPLSQNKRKQICKKYKHFNIRASVETRPPKLHSLTPILSPLPSLTFHGPPPYPSFASFCDTRISSLYNDYTASRVFSLA